MRRRWIRGKALQTLLALRPVQPGDEIVFKRNAESDAGHDDFVEGRVYKVLRDDDEDYNEKATRWGGPDEPVCRGMIAPNNDSEDVWHYFSPSNIAAIRIHHQEETDDANPEVR